MYSYYAQVIGLCLNFLGAVLLLKYSPTTLSFGGVTTTQEWERDYAPQFKKLQKWSRVGLSLFALGFLVQFIGMIILDDTTASVSLMIIPAVEPRVRKLIAICGGLVVTLIMGTFIDCVLDKMTSPKAPEGIDANQLRDSLLVGKENTKAASRLGFMERLLFFTSIYSETFSLGGGWLAFKVASKWAAWQNIIKMPDSFPYDNSAKVMEVIRVKNQWGSDLLMRFLLGNLYNVICGLTGAVVSWFILATLTPPPSP